MVGEADGVPLVDGGGFVVVVLLVVLGPVELWNIRTCTRGSHFAKVLDVVHYVHNRFASLPVLTVLVDVVVRVPLVTGGEPMLVVWACVTVLVGIGDGVPLVTGDESVLVGVWPCVTVLVGVVDGVPLVTGDESVLVGVWPCVTVLVGVVDGVPLVGSGVDVAEGVGSTVLVLLVVVNPVEMCEIYTYMYLWGSLFIRTYLLMKNDVMYVTVTSERLTTTCCKKYVA